MACHSSQKTTTALAETTTVINQFTVSFISIGAGTDVSAKTAYDTYIENFAKQNKVKLIYDKVNWGREGEMDYCFDLSPLKADVKALFIEETKRLLASSKLVRYAENTSCRSPRK